MKIGLLLISTKAYRQFVLPLLETVWGYFMPDNLVNVYLFTDKKLPVIGGVKQFIIPPYGFPEATMFRYKIFTHFKDEIDADFLLYSDVDMKIVDFIREDIIPNGKTDNGILAVRHPGFYARGGGSWEKRRESSFYTPNPKAYYCGGVQGGLRDKYLEVAEILSKVIDYDLNRGVVPIWHDETAINWWLANNPNFKELTPQYCYPDKQDTANRWGLGEIKPKILALSKNHEEIRK